jgi:hypothetical protein
MKFGGWCGAERQRKSTPQTNREDVIMQLNSNMIVDGQQCRGNRCSARYICTSVHPLLCPGRGTDCNDLLYPDVAFTSSLLIFCAEVRLMAERVPWRRCRCVRATAYGRGRYS